MNSKKDFSARGIKTFYFEAIDPRSELIKGTIEAKTLHDAHHRLEDEFKFKIKSLSEKQREVPIKPKKDLLKKITHKLKKFQHRRKIKKERKTISRLTKVKTEHLLSKPTPRFKTPKSGHQTIFSIDVGSFVGWLLFFYISYFYLVSFSVEKKIGLDEHFALNSIDNPLLLNITFLLLMTHLTLYLKKYYLKDELAPTLFLSFFNIGLFTYCILNF